MFERIYIEPFKRYVILLTTTFIFLIIFVIWGLKFSYYAVIENNLSSVLDKVEAEITSSYSTDKKSIKLHKLDDSNMVQVYESIDDKYELVFNASDNNITTNTHTLMEGLHVELLKTMNLNQYYAVFDKTFEVYKHKYHIVVYRSLYTFFEVKKLFLILFILFTGILYGVLLYIGHRYISYFVWSMNRIIEEISSVSKGDSSQRLSLTKYKDQFHTLSQEINTMLKILDSTLINSKRFNAKVSHELRTPLTIIRGEIEVALCTNRSVQEYKEILYSTIEEIDTLQSIVDNMTLLTKIDIKTLKMKKFNARLDKIIEEAIVSCDIQREVKSMQINSNLEQVNYPIDEILIRLGIKNLILNAIKYSPRESIIKISLKKKGHEIIFEIEDEGYGISKKDIVKIFEPHYRSESRVIEEIYGEGLGLSIVQHIMQLHNASLEVESTLNKGSKFTIIFKE